MIFSHIPVMLEECMEGLDLKPGGVYFDGTVGGAGHSYEILKRTTPDGRLIATDLDDEAIAAANQRLSGFKGRFEIYKSNYKDFEEVLKKADVKSLDGALLDFGVSSYQLDNRERGFSYLGTDAPLDMRMDQTQDLNASVIVNKWRESEIVDILERYGEEKPGFAKLIARTIVHGRPWTSTKQLGETLAKFGRGGRVHPATRTFQAIRIAVNDELGEIERTLPLIPKLLRPGGRVAMITFHSLEDRLVKDFLKAESSLGEESPLEVLTKKPITAENEELFINPRARSAKLRAAKKK